MLTDRLKERREQVGYTQEELANKVGVTKQSISKYEKGLQSPTSIVLSAIADVLECSTDYLLGRSGRV